MFRGRQDPLLRFARMAFLTHLSEFGPSKPVQNRLHKSDQGVYLVVAGPSLAPSGDLVGMVGWARNDYWAVQIWGHAGRGFTNPFDPDAPTSPQPSLEPLGWPHPLRYAETLEHAKKRAGKRIMVSANYDLSEAIHGEGETPFTSHIMHASPDVEFHYDTPNPHPADTPAVVELTLGGHRRKRFLQEQRAHARDWERRRQP